MKTPYQLLPIFYIFLAVSAFLIIMDKKATLRPEPVETKTDHNLGMDGIIEQLNTRDQTICGKYLSRRVGLRNYYGIVCIVKGVEVVIWGNINITHSEYGERVSPVADSLRKEYRIRHGEY